MHHYLRFLITILVSTVAMFVMMYLNTYRIDHVYFSETRLYMAIMMGAGMAVIMLLCMWSMYPYAKLNIVILLVAAGVFGGSLGLVRTQATIEDVAWMKGMIPHHSIAILTSSRATLEDPRVQDLARRIIEAQQSEIEEMKGLIRDLESAN